jgi:hypothetical protein
MESSGETLMLRQHSNRRRAQQAVSDWQWKLQLVPTGTGEPALAALR